MPDIFLSYSREDRSRVEPLAEALVQAGYSVWWDRNLTGGRRFLDETQGQLSEAKAVLVVWTKTSVNSHWVADEASEGRDTGRLVPITLDGTMPPLGFRQFQVLDFSRWEPGDEALLKDLRAALSRLIDNPTIPAALVAAARPARLPLSRRTLVIGSLVAAGLIVLASVALLATQTGSKPETPRLAFFGFVARDDDPAKAQIADTATTEVFEALSAQQVRMAARSETLGTAIAEQFARASALGARFTLSGDMKPEPGKPDEVRVAIRLEDATTRTTLWEESFANDATEPLQVAVRAATRAVDTSLCVVRHYARLASGAADADLLTPLATYCAGWRGQGTPEADRALQRLAELAPDDGELQGIFAVKRLDQAHAVSVSSPDPAMIGEAEQAFNRAQALDPAGFYVTFARYEFATLHRRPLTELEAILRAGLRTRREQDWQTTGYQLVVGYVGSVLSWAGRYDAAIPHLQAATNADPFSLARRIRYVQALVDTNRVEAGAALRELARRWDADLVAEMRLVASVIYGTGDAARQLLAAPPKSAAAPTIECWRSADAAIQSGRPQRRADGVVQVKACLKAGSLREFPALLLLVQLGDLDGAFALAEAPTFRPQDSFAGFGYGSSVFFVGPTRAMRADPRFLPLMEKLGLMDYWRTTRTAPDICATESAPFCKALKDPAEK